MSLSNHSGEGSNRKVSCEMVLALFGRLERPVLFTSDVVEEFDCSDQTARNRFAELVEANELTRVDLGGRRAAWLRADHSEASGIARQLRQQFDLTNLKTEHLDTFAETPYKLVETAENEYHVHVPRFVPFSCGYLKEIDGGYETYVLNKYHYWLGNLPEPIEDEFELTKRYAEATVEDQLLVLSDADEREQAWEDFGGDEGDIVDERIEENKIRIQAGKEIEVLAELIKHGNLPHSASQISDDKLREPTESINLRPYQKHAWESFKETGQIGIYWPPGGGKTYLSMYAGDRLEGEKLVIVPKRDLISQWKTRIHDYCRLPDEWSVETYQYLIVEDNLHEYQRDDSPILTIFDEAHRLPADNFSKLATVPTDYRIGCSASPYREDGRNDLIYALTGVPVGNSWDEILRHTDMEYPDVDVFIYSSQSAKRADVERMLNEDGGKTLIFCDRLAKGKDLASDLGVPFISGETAGDDRMEAFDDHEQIIASRIADEGLSFGDLERVIEHDFHGSSRRQELQRFGRLMHSKEKGHYIVQMTQEEYSRYGDRLLSLMENGIDIQPTYRNT